MSLFNYEKGEGDKWREGVYLTTVWSSLEADIIESKLRSEDIPFVRRYEGAANFIEIATGGNTIQNIQIFVPEELLEDAKNVIKPVPLDDDFDPGEA